MMNATSAWIPVSSAIAALFGASLGAMLQGRFGVSGWRRQIRLEAYTNFVNATHDFHNQFIDALAAFGEPEFDDSWKEVRRAETLIGRAGSLVSMAGPLSMDKAAREVVAKVRVLTQDGKDPDTLSQMVRARKEGRAHEHLTDWIDTASRFADAGRTVLKTQRLS